MVSVAHASNDARQDAQYSTPLRSSEPAREGVAGVEVSVVGSTLVVEDTGLPLELEDGAVHVGLAQNHAGVVDQIARREIVGSVHHHVVGLDDLQRVLAGQRFLVDVDLDVGIDVLDPLSRGLNLRTTH